jgi:hypothetical protein
MPGGRGRTGMTERKLSMSVGRDYRTNSKYEYVIFEGEKVVQREGYYTTSTQAKRAGLKAANLLLDSAA